MPLSIHTLFEKGKQYLLEWKKNPKRMNCNGAYLPTPQPSASIHFRCQMSVGVNSYMFIEKTLLVWSWDVKEYEILDVKYSVMFHGKNCKRKAIFLVSRPSWFPSDFSLADSLFYSSILYHVKRGFQFFISSSQWMEGLQHIFT